MQKIKRHIISFLTILVAGYLGSFVGNLFWFGNGLIFVPAIVAGVVFFGILYAKERFFSIKGDNGAN